MSIIKCVWFTFLQPSQDTQYWCPWMTFSTISASCQWFSLHWSLYTDEAMLGQSTDLPGLHRWRWGHRHWGRMCWGRSRLRPSDCPWWPPGDTQTCWPDLPPKDLYIYIINCSTGILYRMIRIIELHRLYTYKFTLVPLNLDLQAIHYGCYIL